MVNAYGHRDGTEPDGVSPPPARDVGGADPGGDAAQATIPVWGMTCDSCADNVHRALSHLDGVGRVDVDLAEARAVVHGSSAALDDATLQAAVERIGYATTPPTPPAGSRLARWKPLGSVAVAVVAVLAGVVLFRLASGAYRAPEAIEGLNGVFSTVTPMALGLALVIGLLVAFAPSTLAMAPAVMGYVSAGEEGSTRRAVALSAVFLGGLLLATMGVGALFALGGSAAIRAVSARLPLWYGLLAVVLVAMAGVLLGGWQPSLPGFVPRLPRTGGYVGAFLLGVPFGLTACPSCTPLLLPLAVGAGATGDPVYGAGLLGLFGLGRGVPLLLLGTLTGSLQTRQRVARWRATAERVVGVLLLVAAGWFAVSALTYAGLL